MATEKVDNMTFTNGYKTVTYKGETYKISKADYKKHGNLIKAAKAQKGGGKDDGKDGWVPTGRENAQTGEKEMGPASEVKHPSGLGKSDVTMPTVYIDPNGKYKNDREAAIGKISRDKNVDLSVAESMYDNENKSSKSSSSSGTAYNSNTEGSTGNSPTTGVTANTEGKFNYTLNGQTVYVTQEEVDAAGNIAKAGKIKMGITDDTGNTTGTNDGTSVDAEKALKAAYDIIDAALKKGDLSQTQADSYKRVVADWDPSQLINVENVLRDYKKVADETIDPYWKQQLHFETGVLQKTVEQEERDRALEIEQNEAIAEGNIEKAQALNEQSGMTFTGKGIEDLGAKSAFSQDDSSIPSQTPFGGVFEEGKVNQANKLMTSSALANYQKTLTKLGQSAEQSIGSKGVEGLVPGYTPTTDNLEGSINTGWNTAKGDAFLKQMDYWDSKNQLNSNMVDV